MDSNSFSPSTRQVIDTAVRRCWRFRSGYVGVEHLFLGLVGSGGPDVLRAFQGADLDMERLDTVVASWLRDDRQQIQREEPGFTPRLEQVLSSASLVAARSGESHVHPLHLLVALLEDDRSIPARILDGIRRKGEASAVPVLIQQARRVLELRRVTNHTLHEGSEIERFAQTIVGDKTGKSVVGRDAEFQDLANELLAGHRPMVVGESGIGKTSLFRGLADWLSGEHSNPELRAIQLYRVTPATIRLGLKPGRPEQLQVESFLAAAWEDENAYLVLEDISEFLESDAESGVDVAFRNALTRGSLRCVGTTTPAGFARLEAREPGLLRRFTPYQLDELNPQSVLVVLNSMRSRLEEFHDAELSEDSILAAIELSQRYLPEDRLPGKAIDVLDQAGAATLLRGLQPRDSLESLDEIYVGRRTLTRADVIDAVAKSARAPSEYLDPASLDEIGETLRLRLAGQGNAIEQMESALSAPQRRPETRSTLLFHGPPGVGKSESARAIAERYCGRADCILRLDLAEYQGEEGIRDLLQVTKRRGYFREGALVTHLRRSPWAVVFFDGADQADELVQQELAASLKSGSLADGPGRSGISLSDAIFVFSCLSTGPGSVVALHSSLRSCVDAEIAFDFLTQEELGEVLDLRLQGLLQELSSFGLRLTVKEELREDLLLSGAEGARALQRGLERMLVRPLRNRLLDRQPEDTRLLADRAGVRFTPD